MIYLIGTRASRMGHTPLSSTINQCRAIIHDSKAVQREGRSVTVLSGLFWNMRHWKAVVAPPWRALPDMVANSIGCFAAPASVLPRCCCSCLRDRSTAGTSTCDHLGTVLNATAHMRFRGCCHIAGNASHSSAHQPVSPSPKPASPLSCADRRTRGDPLKRKELRKPRTQYCNSALHLRPAALGYVCYNTHAQNGLGKGLGLSGENDTLKKA